MTLQEPAGAATSRSPVTVAGCDYSTRVVHVAVVHGKQLAWCRAFMLGTTPETHVAALLMVVEALIAAGVAQLWMEEMWFGATSQVHTLKLHRVPTRLETLMLEHTRIATKFVHVPTWHAAILGNGHIRTEEAKLASRRFAAAAYGFRTNDDNAADAICLAAYGEALHRFRGLIPSARGG